MDDPTSLAHIAPDDVAELLSTPMQHDAQRRFERIPRIGTTRTAAPCDMAIGTNQHGAVGLDAEVRSPTLCGSVRVFVVPVDVTCERDAERFTDRHRNIAPGLPLRTREDGVAEIDQIVRG